MLNSSTGHLLDYLYEECQNTGVAFRFGQEINRIEKSMRGQLQAVDIGSSTPGNNDETNIACHNIIVAAGAQTPEALGDIITWLEPKTTFENHKESYEWVRAPIGDAFDGEELQDVSLIIRNDNSVTGKGKAKADDSSSSAFSILTPDPETDTVLAVTIANPITPTQRSKPAPGADLRKNFSAAEKVARTHLKNGKLAIPVAAAASKSQKNNTNSSSDSDSSDSSNSNSAPKSPLPPKTSGSATISTSFSHAPLVTMIPWAIVDPRTKETVSRDDGAAAKSTIHSLGIYVAYGLGRHGTTLAPGAARMVVSRVYGDAGKEDGKGAMDAEDAGVLAEVGEKYGWPEGFEP